MATQNNLIRAPILNNNNNNGNNDPPPFQMNREIELASAVRRVLQEELHPVPTQPTDQDVNIINGDLSGLDKVPDVVRTLREFSGNHTEFASWKKSVERILKIYEPIRGTPKYF